MKVLTVALSRMIYLTIMVHTSKDTYYNRIGGGNLTSIAKHRYMVSLVVYRSCAPSTEYFLFIEKFKKDVCLCGGTIIGEYWVLTAASCIFDRELQDLMERQHMVVRGNTTHCSSGRNRIDHPIVGIKVHEKYPIHYDDIYDLDENYNIGLLKVSKSFTGYFERKIRLYNRKVPELTLTMLNSPWYLAGWGSTEPRYMDFEPSNHLKYVDVYYINSILCRPSSRYSDRLQLQPVNNICVGHLEGEWSCFADTGGPLYFEFDDEIWQIGIVPNRIVHPCTANNSQDIYLAVSTFHEWISKNTARAADHLNKNTCTSGKPERVL